MKKLLLLTAAFSISLSVYTQNLKTANNGVKVIPASTGMKAMKMEKVATRRDEAPVAGQRQTKAARNNIGKNTVSKNQNGMQILSSILTETIIGNTMYDLQTNRGPAKRISNNGDGTLSVVWTGSAGPFGTWPDRGTGYNYYDGTNWNLPPAVIIDPIRTGYPTIDYTPQAGEIVVSHTGAQGLLETFRPTKGTGLWDTTTVGSFNLYPSQEDVWSRMAIGGVNGTTIHVITNSQGTGTTPVLGQNGPLTYSRSLNGGVTWVDDHIQLPGNTAANYFGVGADEYHIDARGDVIAIVEGGFTNDVVLFKSMDNGVTWTKTVVKAFPIPLFDETTMNTDINSDGVADTIETNAGDVTVTIDNSNIAHIAFGNMHVYEDVGGTAISYFPTDDGLMYWNESMGSSPPILIAAAEDFNGNGVIDIPQNPNGSGFGLYNTGFTSQPSIGIDGSNGIYIAYSTIDERADTASYQQALRHIFLITSPDYGLTWSSPFCVVDDPAGTGAFEEAVWPSVATLVDNNVHIVYQRDFAPGTSLSTDPLIAANNSQGPSDIVYAKVFAPAITNHNTITGSCYIDLNSNGIRDVNENGYNNLTVSSTGGYTYASQPNNNGYFSNYADTGATITTIQNLNYYSFAPLQHTSTFTTYLNIDTVNFALVPIPGIQDLSLSLLPLSPARPGFNATYRIVYENIGTVAMSGNISLVKDSSQTYVSSSATVTNFNGDTLEFTYANLAPAETRYIDITFHIAPPPTVNFGDVLSLNAFIDPLIADTNPENNGITINQGAVGSYDPNDKTMLGGDNITPSQVSNGDYLHYLIRFQNTGNDTAFTVIVRDTLSSNLNWNSLKMEDASHPYNLTITNGNILKWQFNQINLPDSNVNEPASHGYICYKVKPINSLSLGATINNTAHIYFDFNQPVSTNTAHTIVSVVGLNEISGTLTPIHVFPNPSNNSCTITALSLTNATLLLYDIAGRVLLKEKFNEQSIIDVSSLNTGMYLIEIKDEEGRSVKGKLLRD